MILLSYSNSSIKGTEILGSILYLSLLRPALYVCNLEENLLFFTLILGSVVSDYVVFYGDFIICSMLYAIAMGQIMTDVFTAGVKRDRDVA